MEPIINIMYMYWKLSKLGNDKNKKGILNSLVKLVKYYVPVLLFSGKKKWTTS